MKLLAMEFLTYNAILVAIIIGVSLPLLFLIAGLLQLWRPSSNLKNKSQQEKKLPLPPGRLGLPFIGESLEFIGTQKKGIPRKFIDDRISAYGDIFKTSLIASPTIVLARPSGNKAAFSSSYSVWPISVVSVLGNESLMSCVGPPATRIRNALMLFLRPESLQRYTSRVDHITLAFIRDHIEGKSKVALFPLMKKLMFTIACEVLIGRGDRKDQDVVHGPLDTMVKGLFQLPINIPGTPYSKAHAASDAIRKQLQVWIDERRRDMDAGLVTGHEDILSGFLCYRDEQGEPFSDKAIKDNILTLLFAGHDTSSSVATMTCKYLASNPDIMDQVYKGLLNAPPITLISFLITAHIRVFMICMCFSVVVVVLAQRTWRSRQARPPVSS